uniref:Uncharacterized protein n=1 Tax=Strongyloides venezuelensis TaxID=75913 RepID=A0A0K0EVI3_STRVS
MTLLNLRRIGAQSVVSLSFPLSGGTVGSEYELNDVWTNCCYMGLVNIKISLIFFKYSYFIGFFVDFFSCNSTPIGIFNVYTVLSSYYSRFQVRFVI